MKRIYAVLLAIVALLMMQTGAAFAEQSPPAAQSHVGQATPLGYVPAAVGSNGGSGVYFTEFLVRDDTQIQTWYGTYGARCIYVGINTLPDQSTHDGIGRWICEQYTPYSHGEVVPNAVPRTQFFTSLHAWTQTTTRFADCSTVTCYRRSINPVTHNVNIDMFTLL